MKRQNSNKKRIIKDFESLDKAIKEQIKLVYPDGYSDYLIEFKNRYDEYVSALPFETDDTIYLIKMSINKAKRLIAEDDDFDDEGKLKQEVKEKYEDEYDDIDYLDNNFYDENE